MKPYLRSDEGMETGAEDKLGELVKDVERLKKEILAKKSLSDLIYSDIQNFVAFSLIVLSIILIFAALVVGVVWPQTSSETTSAVLQIMSAVLLAVVGFYFGSRGAQKAQEVADTAIKEREEAKVQAKTAIAEKEQVEGKIKVVQKEKTEAENTAEAWKLNSEALDLHYADKRDDARQKYLDALKLAQNDRYTRAKILTNFVYLLLDYSDRNYYDIERYSQEATRLFETLDLEELDPQGFWSKLSILARAVILGNINRETEAVEILNRLGQDIEQFGYAFNEGNLRREHFQWITKCALEEKLSPIVVNFLKNKKVM
jgi:hypothetical protein